MILETERTILRPFADADAADVFAYAKRPEVGPIAGWKPHESIEESREIIRTVFAAPNVFAVTDRETGRVIGSAGFEGRPRGKGPSDELGYALHPGYWGRGLIPEAARELLRWGFEELGLRTIWCGHYEGNLKSRRVIEKCGFVYRFSQETDVPLMGERRVTPFFALPPEEWDGLRCASSGGDN